MKSYPFARYLYLFFILAVTMLSCNRPPDLPPTPAISFHSIAFEILNEGTIQQEELLKLSFNFEDGDGDLGLEGDENAPPYHPYDVITENGTPVEFGQRDGDPDFTCINYVFEDSEDIDFNSDGDKLDTILIDFNENQYNIEIDFFVKRNGTFEEVEIRAQPPGSQNANTLCGITYDGRFPCLAQKGEACENNGPLEGVITYNMPSSGFLTLFRTDTLMLRFQIRDRALHESNFVETPEFTLQNIHD